MSVTTNNNAAAVTPAKDDNEQANLEVINTAAASIASMKPAYERAETTQLAIQQTVAAILMELCRREVYLTVKVGEKDVSSTTSMDGLIGLDGDNRKASGSATMYQACWAFVSMNLGCEKQVSENIVQFAARLAKLGYTLADFNGTVNADMTVALPEVDMATAPMQQWPGFFRVRPLHTARKTGDNVTRDVEVADKIEVVREGVKSDGYVPAKDQRVILANRFIDFIAGEPDRFGQKPWFKQRIGRTTFMTVSKAVMESDIALARLVDAKRRADEEASRNPPPPVATAGPGNPNRGEGEGEPATTGGPAPTVTTTTPAPASSTPAQANGTTTAPTANGATTTPTANNGGSAATAQDTGSRATAAATTRNQEVRAEDAITPVKLNELIRLHFAPAKVKGNETLTAQLMHLHAYSTGVLKVLGYNDFLANPTDANAIKMAKLTAMPAAPAKANKSGGNKR